MRDVQPRPLPLHAGLLAGLLGVVTAITVVTAAIAASIAGSDSQPAGAGPAPTAAPRAPAASEPDAEPCAFDPALEADDPDCLPPPDPVRGDVEVVEIVDLSVTGTQLFRPGSEGDAPVPVDDAAVATAASASAQVVDRLLTLLQEDGTPELRLTGDLAALASLASAAQPIRAARYEVRVGARGVPEWLELRAALQRDDGARTATFAFSGGDEPVLLAVDLGMDVTG